jgi:DNA polymerase III delta subunit
MIYIVATTDIQIKNKKIKEYTKNSDTLVFDGSVVTKDVLRDYAQSVDLFGSSPVLIIEGFIKEGKETLGVKELVVLKESPTVFIFCEDVLKAADQKKYAAYADITVSAEKKLASVPKVNVFAVADAYGRKDKITAWILYRDAISHGIEPEAISGMLFWKIKTLILQGTKVFDIEVLKKNSGELVSLYHDAHLGRKDFVVGLEQFILNTLS